jgi:hypothetical protein
LHSLTGLANTIELAMHRFCALHESASPLTLQSSAGSKMNAMSCADHVENLSPHSKATIYSVARLPIADDERFLHTTWETRH